MHLYFTVFTGLLFRGVDPLGVSGILLVLPHYCYATVTEASISLRCLPFVLDNTTICFASWVFLCSSTVSQNMSTLCLSVYSIGTEHIVFTTKVSYFLISLLGIQCSKICLVYRFTSQSITYIVLLVIRISIFYSTRLKAFPITVAL